ncbi:S66 peptidase family protein [Clostridium saccharobutylicum]|uniref:Murein peptide carboxypeptidase YkfA n=1 Tax=Clostridium saccharobutylicum DSM 13864 TaxID=1345695 RepID=U5N0U7_CLOSA|nr:LD-carboxypeptidase [Clostridium saccharobutylicum]AGX45377.1 murein peptide carboxypeptidase YkfA [Clostridium saccharobutylicum DSM 13864]AQR92652.1 putative murein peptide carboxypeptidase [Clostridium saccharobutylicum]AQS02554.1 putative murein peptide carboxypeptidase [Clostridium saccharobutylicum]AQS16537.1 putative murein peptide carboxypeptidase [Clostridium saccharobutylicum]MBA2906751.1 muramoyltetrapeptide carboxypeptidase [Clostridium saccharobutylicum]
MATKPQILRPGDTVGIVTLGSPLYENVINARIQTLQNFGLKVVLGKYVYSYNGYLAATEQQRASDLMDMFKNPDVKAIIPSRGGVGVAGIIPYLDFSVIAQNPKIVTGYSDITILLNALYTLADLITFHSLLLIDFEATTPEYNFNQFFTATATLTSPRQLENPPEIPLISRVPGNVTGPIVGGNLTSFVDNLGTPFEVDTKGKIILIEDVHEPVNTIYRYINHLILAGKFKDCAGIIMGECSQCVTAYDKSYDDLIDEVMVPLNKPLMTNLASGHGKYKMAIPIGAQANLNTYNNTLTVLEPTVHI